MPHHKMASSDSSQCSDDANELSKDYAEDPLSSNHHIPSALYHTKMHSHGVHALPGNLPDDPTQGGSSSLDPSSLGPSCSSWSPPPELPLEFPSEMSFIPRNSPHGTSPSEIDRSNTSSPFSDSSLGESRSPVVNWRDGSDSPEEECGGDIPTRMFSNTSHQRKRVHSDDYYYRTHTKLPKHDSCVSDMSEFSPDSANGSTTSPKDESNGLNSHSSSGMNSDQEKQAKISQATFDKVLIDANQRRHIRNKARNTGTDSGSDSSSGNICMDMKNVVGTSTSVIKLDSTTSESSGIGNNCLSSAQCDLPLPRSTIMQGGITNSSTGVSTMYNSQGNKVSDESKQDSMSSGCSGARKRHIPWSIARYYYQTKRLPVSQENADEGTAEPGNTLNKRLIHPERKRKRFHRTFTALRQCGLLDLTMQTASLMEQNAKLQKQLGELHRQAHLMYHTVSHFSKIHPNGFGSPEAQKVIDGLKEMVDRNPVGDIDMSMFESTSGSRDSPPDESGAFTLSNQIPSLSVESALSLPGTSRMSGSQRNTGQQNGSDSAIQSSITTTSSSSEKSGQ